MYSLPLFTQSLTIPNNVPISNRAHIIGTHNYLALNMHPRPIHINKISLSDDRKIQKRITRFYRREVMQLLEENQVASTKKIDKIVTSSLIRKILTRFMKETFTEWVYLPDYIDSILPFMLKKLKSHIKGL